MNLRATGIDPSLTGTGIAHSDGRCRRIGQQHVTKLNLTGRVAAVDGLVAAILEEIGRPDLALIEVPAYSRSGGGQVERHALWWMVAGRLLAAGIPVAEVSIQARIRYATGKGTATKGAVLDAVARRLPMFETNGDDNLADAAILAAMGADYLGQPLAAMPASHRQALDSVTWPSHRKAA